MRKRKKDYVVFDTFLSFVSEELKDQQKSPKATVNKHIAEIVKLEEFRKLKKKYLNQLFQNFKWLKKTARKLIDSQRTAKMCHGVKG